MKRIIYIGDYSGQTIYFDTKKKVILKTKSSSLLNSEKTKNSPKQVVMIITGLILFQPLLRFLLVQFDLVDHNVGLVPFFVLFGYSLVAIGLSWLVYIALYGNSKNLELASKQEFRRAVASNNFGQFMGVSTGSKKFLWAKVKNIFLMSCVIMVGILSLFVITTVFDVQLSFTDAISGVMAGIGPALIFIIFWLNNPFRWLLIVERFAKNKIDWAPEAFEFSESLKKKRRRQKMRNNILPLGSVVTLKDGDGTELMIITRGALIEENGQEAYFDYGSVIVPHGMVTPEHLYFFNRENVEEVIFKGYANEAEHAFASAYDQHIEDSGLPKASVY